MPILTPKQEGFCLSYIETGNASEAYRRNYNAANMKPETLVVKASELLKNGKVAAMVEQLKTVHAERHNITVDSMYKNAIDKAYEHDQINTVVTAIGGLAKLHGLLVDKKLHGNDPNNPLPPYVEVRFIDPCLAVAKV
jgi:phage terminase small subunit